MIIINRVFGKLRRTYNEKFLFPRRVKGAVKIFCIGRNKTATTSLIHTFEQLGYITGNEYAAGLLLDDYLKKDFKPIVHFCKTAQVFKDVPFSLPETYIHLDRAYPGSKFILSVRDSPEQWYNSVVKFHSKIFGKGRLPTEHDLKNALYIKKGWSWKLFKELYGTPDNDLYNKEILIKHYEDYNAGVTNYFKGRSNLLVLNLSDTDAYSKFCDFLGIESEIGAFPRHNRTENITIKS